MDVSIKPTDKQAREATIKARDDKETARATREEKRKARKAGKRGPVINRRLRHRIEREVRADLLNEKKCYLKAEPSDGEYVIDTRIRYGWSLRRKWRYEPVTVKRIFQEVIAMHTGFEHKADYNCRRGNWCDEIRVQYTLLDQTTTPSREEST